MLGRNPTSLQNAITIVQKGDPELHVIEGLYNHDPEHKINHISNKKYHSQISNSGPCHGCSVPHLIRDCKNSVCKRCKPDVDNHVPVQCPKHVLCQTTMVQFLIQQQPHRNWFIGHNDPALQFVISTSSPDHISELLEATKMTKYFKKSYKGANHTLLIMIITTPINLRVVHIIWTNMSAKHITIMKRLMK